MKLLLYSLNYAPELTGIGKFNAEMVSDLADYGVDSLVLTAPPYYPQWEQQKGYSYKYYTSEVLDGVEVHRCPIYVPSKVTLFKRVLHLLSFACSSGLRLLTLLRKKPDLVFLVQPTFFCVPLTLFYCKLTGAKSLMHIQDYELDAMLGLGMGSQNFFTSLMKKLERLMLGRFDIVSTISYSMINIAGTSSHFCNGKNLTLLKFLDSASCINSLT